MLDPVRWQPAGTEPLPGKVRLIDQTRLPTAVVYVELTTAATVHDAIRRLVVRGAPAIGIAAAFGLTAAVQDSAAATIDAFLAELDQQADYLAGARPTAVNLAWALRRCQAAVRAAAATTPTVAALKRRLWQEADAILQEDIAMCRRIGEHGLPLFTRPGLAVLTHCNAGALATGDYGTALAPIYLAHERGLRPQVFSDETRPLLQGSRLTAWELQRAGVPVTTLCDNMAAVLMQAGRIDLVIVGADRIAANGDTANKIGTYGVAVLARHHRVPFYVAAPYSTIDLAVPTGAGIPIEQRRAEEVTHGFGVATAPAGVAVFNPAFDVTPAALIRGIITDRGLLRPPYPARLRRCVGRQAPAPAA